MRPVFCFLELSVELAARLWFVGFGHVYHVKYAPKLSV